MAELSNEFLIYHDENPHVWRLFQRFTLEAANTGRKRIGSQMIFERMRWHSIFETEGDEYKINNNYVADYARMFMEKYPEHLGFFPTRERKVKCVEAMPEERLV